MMWLRAPVVVRMVVAILVLLPLLLTGARGQQQRFRVRPSNVSAVAGHTALLRCEVQHQTGQLQWAKDGFALGYSRSLPGYNRYRMVGDPGSGVHDLEISNVTLEDDGRFQCQVSPNRGQAAIKADAFLTVLVGPSSISTSSTARLLGTGRYEVSRLRQLTIKCDVTGSRPAATVQWQRNGVTVPLDAKESAAEWGHPVRHDTTSVVQLRPTAEDDGAAYSCVAQHPALGNANKALNSTIHLSVLYPPGAPRISGFRSGDVIRLGEQRTLTCSSSGGNPPAQLRWLKNEHPLSSKTRRLPGQTVSELRFRAQRSDLHAEYRCEASSPVQPLPASTTVTVTVQFGPDTVTVTGTPSARGGERVQMHCTTAGSSPAANITWVVNGRTIMNTTQESEDDPLGGQVSRSNLTVTVPEGTEEDVTAACYALNPALGVTKVGTRKITVLHPPRRPTILGYEPGTYLRAGERVSLSCIAQGGNPPATLTWYRAGEEWISRTTVEDNVARNVITFELAMEDNGRAYQCSSQNAASVTRKTANVTLLVHYPPAGVKLSVTPEELRAGSQAILTCESRPSLPPADLTWWRGDAKVTDGVGQLETFPAGNYGGSSSRLQLRRNLVHGDDEAEFQCRATVKELPGLVASATTLSVTYPPVFAENLFTVDIREGSSRTLTFPARANPVPVRYRWLRKSTTGGSTEVAKRRTLNVTAVRREDGGWYTLEAENDEGKSFARVFLNVQYAPKIVSISKVSLVSTGDDGVLECRVDANPVTADLITWRRPSFELRAPRATIFSSNATSYLTIHNVTVSDIGEFECSADNGIGQAKATAKLLVRHAPSVDASPRFSRAAAPVGGSAVLRCRVSGVPQVTYTWAKRGVLIDSSSREKYTITRTQVNLSTRESILKIRDVQPSDFSKYECSAHNELGTARHEVTLEEPRAPDTPAELHVVNVTHDTATLRWQPGFDGGELQMYRVRFKEKGDSAAQYQYRDVQPLNSTSITIGALLATTKYSVAVMAYSRLGDSGYSRPELHFRTTGAAGASQPLATTAAGEQLPWIVIVAVSAVGGVLLLLNAVLVAVFIRRRMRRTQQKVVESASASEASTKSETLHMYGNETVSSMSVKSGESFPREDSIDDYDVSGRQSFGGDGMAMPPAAAEYTNHLRSPSRCDYPRLEAASHAHAHAHPAGSSVASSECGAQSNHYVRSPRRNSYTYSAGSADPPYGSSYNTQPPRAPQFRAHFQTPTPDLLHPSASHGGPAPQLGLRANYYPETSNYCTLPHHRPPHGGAGTAKSLSSFGGRLASPPAPSIPESALEHRGHLV